MELSTARTFVERKLMSTTSPLHVADGDPVADGEGFVQQDDHAAEEILGISCAAREIVRPIRPALATTLPTGRPLSCAMVAPQSTTTATL